MAGYLLLPLMLINILLPQITKSQVQFDKNFASDSIKVKILFKGQGRVILNAHDSQFRYKPLQFGNPTRADTVVYKTIAAIKPVHFWYINSRYNGLTKKLETEQRNFILLPGDSIDLEVKGSSPLSLTKYARFNSFLDTLYNINTKSISAFKRIKISDLSDDQITKLFKGIDHEYIFINDRINKLYAAKSIDSLYKSTLDTFNLMVKYYKISNISFDNEDPLEKVKNHYQEHVNYIKSHLNILQSIDSNYSFGLLYLIIRYDAKIAGHPLENFWEYFDAINESVKSSFSYKSYIFARLETDEKIKTTEQYKQIINKAKKSGINDSRFDSLLISKRNVQNINNLKGKGMVTTTGHPIDYANMISSLKGKYIFVDFWASWCGPCRAQMPIIQSVKEELANENIAFVAVSIDIDKQNNDWLAASKDENLDKEKHNYRLVKGPKNELLQFYKFNSVPRYMLYDKKGALISDNFTSPGNSNFKSELLKHIMN